MRQTLAGKTALISGAGQGIGQGIAKLFSTSGAKLILVDKDPSGLMTLQKELSDTVTATLDISDPSQIEKTLQPIIDLHGPITILVNNAASVTRRAPITELPIEEWNQALSINLTGAFLLSRVSIKQMKEAGGGVILNVASQLGHVAVEGAAAYCTTKGGILQLTRAMALDHAKDNIRVVALSPGAVLTPRLQTIFGSDENAERALRASHPMDRLAQVDEIAQAALFLVSDSASFITGTDLVADGGYIAR